jgi:hypothetical protein
MESSGVMIESSLEVSFSAVAAWRTHQPHIATFDCVPAHLDKLQVTISILWEHNMKHSFTDPPATVTMSPQIPWVRSVAAQRTATSFLNLPAELRNEIYVLALVVPDPLVIISERLYRYLGDQNDSLVSIGDLCSKPICRDQLIMKSDMVASIQEPHPRTIRPN